MSKNEPQSRTEAEALEALQAAIEGLYTTFASYPLRPQLVGCPCCLSAEDEARLHSKRLRDLTMEDLDKYASAALLTFGDADDFRHFLPRLFELAAIEHLPSTDPEVIFGKLLYGGWRAWPHGEQAAVETYFHAFWHYVLARCPFTGEPLWTFAKEDLCSIAQAIDDLGPFLKEWRETRQMSARYHLAQLFDCEDWYAPPYKLADASWERRQAQMHQVIDWVLEPATLEILREAIAQAPAEFVPWLAEATELLDHLQTRNCPDQGHP